MHSSHTKVLQGKLRCSPDNTKKEITGISQQETNYKGIKLQPSQHSAQTQCDKFINTRSHLQIKELDHSLDNLRHNVFIWKTSSRSYQNYKDLSKKQQQQQQQACKNCKQVSDLNMYYGSPGSSYCKQTVIGMSIRDASKRH